MLTISYTAGDRLVLMLAESNATDDAAIRFVVEGDRLDLEIDTPRPGDTTFDHEEKVVLAIDEQVSRVLATMRLDVEVTGDKPKLKLMEQRVNGDD